MTMDSSIESGLGVPLRQVSMEEVITQLSRLEP
jgi:hypothetical protein